jgi:hypothetical protein
MEASEGGPPARRVPGEGRPARRRPVWAPRWRRRLRWSTPPEDVVRRIDADQAVACWVEPGGMVRARPRVYLMLIPLREVAVPGLDPEPLPGVGPDHWLVWQSLTATAQPARLPTDAGLLAKRLRTSRARGGWVVESALARLMAAIYESRAV